MNTKMIAPCGINCTLCLGYQRKKNSCVGCLPEGAKPYHCTVCSIKQCPEKNGDSTVLCDSCQKFPCRRIKDLDKRYRTKYGLSIIENLRVIAENGAEKFLRDDSAKWKCPNCGELLCMHREVCLSCGGINPVIIKK